MISKTAFPQGIFPKIPVAPRESEASAQAQDSYQPSSSFARYAGGATGAVLGAGICAVGMTASALLHAPKALVDEYKSIIHTDELSTGGKAFFGALSWDLPVFGVPAFTALGGAAWGGLQGSFTGADEGPMAAIKASIESVKNYHNHIGELDYNMFHQPDPQA